MCQGVAANVAPDDVVSRTSGPWWMPSCRWRTGRCTASARPPVPWTSVPVSISWIATGPEADDTSVPHGRHWSLSPTAVISPLSFASRTASSFWATFVSWYSSMRMCRNRWR